MKLFLKIFIFLFTNYTIAQSSELKEIDFNNEKKYVIIDINYPVEGIYKVDGNEPITELLPNGYGFYQKEDDIKQPIIWAFESYDNGIPISIKGFDSIKYFLFYQFTNPEDENESNKWHRVEFLIQLKTQKMFINGNRVKVLDKKEKL